MSGEATIRVSCRDGVMGGQACLEGHRLTMQQLEQYTVDEIMERWPYLDRGHVEAALDLWHRSLHLDWCTGASHG